jgi:hypothetical protein
MMIDTRKARRTPGEETAAGRSWTRPSVQRLATGSAEQGSDFTTDLATSLS